MSPNISALLIDNEKSIRFTLTDFLKQVGITPDVLETTQEGVDRIRERYSAPNPEPYDLVFTDLSQYPTGVEVVQEVRKHDSATLCYIMTGGASLKVLAQARELAAADENTGFLTKPIDKTELHKIVEKARTHELYQISS